MSRNKKLAANTVILGFGQLIPKILAIVTLPVLTKAFAPSEYGIYDLVMSFTSLLIPLMTLLIQQSVFRFLIEKDTEDLRKKYISNSIVFILTLSLLFLVILLAVTMLFGLDIKLVISAYILYFFECIYDLTGQISRGINKNSWYAKSSAIYSIVNVAFVLIAYYTKILNINLALVIIGCSYLLSTVYLMFRIKIIRYYDANVVSFETVKEMLKYSIPIVPSAISLWIVNLSDRLIVISALGNASNGIYAAACKIPNLYATGFNIFNLAWTEQASRSVNEEGIKKYYSDLFNSLLKFMIGVLLVMIAFSKIIFNVLIDGKYAEGYNQLPILYVGVLISSLVSFFGSLYIAYKDTNKVGISSTIGAIINIIINIVFIKKIGIYAASISTLISFLIILIYRILDIRRHIKLEYSYKNICISIFLLIASIVLFYFNNIYAMIINLSIAIVFNALFNDAIKMIYIKIKEKIK